MKAPKTPLLKQYFQIKEEYPGVLMAMRVGDFYEFYGEDAEEAAKLLEITLTGKEDGANGRIPMAGMPHHSSQKYFSKLVECGCKVGVCEQLEDPKSAKGLVKRGVTRVLTSGTLVEDSFLSPSRNNFICSVGRFKDVFSVVTLDVSTGEMMGTQLAGGRSDMKSKHAGAPDSLNSGVDGDSFNADVYREILRLSPREIVLPEGMEVLQEKLYEALGVTVNVKGALSLNECVGVLEHSFGVHSLKGLGCTDMPALTTAAGMLLEYVRSIGLSLKHVNKILVYSVEKFMMLDTSTRKSLELTENLMDGSKAYTLLKTLDKTRTSMGGRLLRRWIHEPLLEKKVIEDRLNSVEELKSAVGIRSDLYEELSSMGDIERLVSRVSLGLANPKDLAALLNSLRLLPKFYSLVSSLQGSYFTELKKEFYDYTQPVHILSSGIVEDPPMHTRDGGVIADGFDVELDELRNKVREAKDYIARLEQNERQSLGIPTLKVGYNSVFGYYIEVSKAHLSKVPSHYIRKQTTANAERYITADLKGYESTVLSTHERIVALEDKIFKRICLQLEEYVLQFMATAKAVATIDVVLSFAMVAESKNYSKPRFVDGSVLDIVQGRHPVVEAECGYGDFVPNNLTFGALNLEDNNAECMEKDSSLGVEKETDSLMSLSKDGARLMVLTGPNMSGKSTYLRQVALIVLMAQIGSFVPAESCSLSPCDRIFTRIGAKDEIALGQSTFMVEMLECANILRNATPDSLLIMDEVGRGTSTYDGLAIAWSMLEFLADRGCKTLFATHYHQLNSLADKFPSIVNYRVMVEEYGSDIVWTHRVVPGGADKSYGIHVAKMAGVPESVICRAGDVLKSLESGSANTRNRDNDFFAEDNQCSDVQDDLAVDSLSQQDASDYYYKIDKKRTGKDGRVAEPNASSVVLKENENKESYIVKSSIKKKTSTDKDPDKQLDLF